MHEVSLVAALIEQAEIRAAGRPVTLVRVRHASSITEPSLRQAFEMLTEGTSLADVTLDTETFTLDFQCASCGFDGVLGHDDLIAGSIAVCPSCGEISTRSRTAELELLEVRTGP